MQPVEGLHSVRTMAAMVAARDPHVSGRASQSASLPVSQPVSQPTNQPASQSVSQPVSQSLDQSAQSVGSCLVSQGCCIQVPVVFLEDQSSYTEYGAASWPLFASAGFFGQLSSSEVTSGSAVVVAPWCFSLIISHRVFEYLSQFPAHLIKASADTGATQLCVRRQRDSPLLKMRY